MVEGLQKCMQGIYNDMAWGKLILTAQGLSKYRDSIAIRGDYVFSV